MNNTPVGIDIGNTDTNICVSWPGCKDGLVAKLPSRYSYEQPPGQLNASGQQGKPKAFPLHFVQENTDLELWFGQDTLAVPAIQKLDELKYDPAHISILLRAALYQWTLTHRGRHKVKLEDLGTLNIVASMPPGMFEDARLFAKATKAYKVAFNGRSKQSHAKIRDGKKSIQIVTQFGGLQQEAVAFGSDIPRRGEWVLVVDLGGGTDDYALYNGSAKPRKTKTSNTGLLHVFQQINPTDPDLAELEVLRGGNISKPLLTYYNEVERRIQLFIRRLPTQVGKIYIIGGGAALMPTSVQKTIKQLAPVVIIGDEYANCRANWRAAGGK